MYYSNETPTGTIDGSNKTFTLTHTINTIVVVTVDGSIYSGAITYVQGSSSFTLADAPTTSITVSYYSGTSGITSNGVTVSELRTAFENRKSDITDVSTSLFLQWCNIINQFVYKKIRGSNLREYVQEASYSVLEEPSSQSLPNNFSSMAELGTGVFYKEDDGDQTKYQLTKTGFGAQTKGYYLTGGNIVFTGINDGSVYILRYLAKVSKLTSISDNLILDYEYIDYLIKAIDVLYSIWDEDEGGEYMADQRFVRVLSELLDNINAESNAYGISNNYNAY